jgi:hypothetical protein
MRAAALATLAVAAFAYSAAAWGQSPPVGSATPASPPPAAAGGAPAAAPDTANAPPGSITRDQYIQDAQQRAARAAATRFDEMDTNHDGIVTPDEMKAYRAAHSRHSSTAPPSH